jgi:hypothetical protein
LSRLLKVSKTDRSSDLNKFELINGQRMVWTYQKRWTDELTTFSVIARDIANCVGDRSSNWF